MVWAVCLLLAAPPAPVPDPRHLSHGRVIPTEGYADQPYIVVADDGAWVCVVTTGRGAEGAAGQHVVSRRSRDQGRTWEPAVDIEPADGPEASYAVLLKATGGRLYAFYNHNTDRVPEVKREDGGAFKRVDSLGHYVFKYSDDHGKSWSPKRYEVPVREFECDRRNVYGGKLRFFWNVGRPLVRDGVALLTLHKVGAMGPGFFAQSEGAFFRSPNLLTERDPAKITFETLPDGDVGLRPPPGGGRVAEEQSVVALSDGTLYCVYRTVAGWPASAYSRDGGRTWTPPAFATYTPGGRRIKHPRAANFVWKTKRSVYLYWFHNHGGRGLADPYADRNPAWLVAGREIDTPEGKRLEWGQPEVLLYDDDPYIRMSYPDLVEDGGRTFVTETQKNIARVHEISPQLLDGLFQQFNRAVVATKPLYDSGDKPPAEFPSPKLPALNRRDTKSEDMRGDDLRAGFSFEFWLTPGGAETLYAGGGVRVERTACDTLRLTLTDGRQEVAWESDPGPCRHAVLTVDGGPKLITVVRDGVLDDGGDARQFGWGRYSPTLRTPAGSPTVKLGPSVRRLRVYARPLTTSEAVASFRAGQ